MEAFSLNFSGTVQGIGFRPYLYKLANDLNLKGQIKNNPDGVSAYLEGKKENLEIFLNKLSEQTPFNAKIESFSKKWMEPIGLQELSILKSEVSDTGVISTPPDLATCKKCFEEFSDVNNRRFNYPLISCTDCGPRYSIIDELPFDRERTSYKDFFLCKECLDEYQNPGDRRYHAQTTGCTKCGPNIFSIPKEIKIHQFLHSGKILGLKGIGGFQLICNAQDIEAVKKLRERKNRPHRPLAVMAKNLELIRKVCEVTIEEEKLLISNIAPIVILALKNQILPEIISPDSKTIGFFLPTTPLHQQLFGEDLDYLIVTSANDQGFPIATNEKEIIPSLADGVISNNRPIISRCDDSVYQGINLIRPGRGIAPLIFRHNKKINKSILALGADLKNTICLSKENKSYLSPHIGDLYNFPTFLDLKKQINKFSSLLKIKPDVIAVDLHPNYYSSLLGRELSQEKGIKLIEVAHHHAHALSAMEEYNLEEAYAFTFDGTGYGPDGTLWGGELLHVFPRSFKRIACLKPFLLPGGEQTIKDPKRQLTARYIEMGLDVEDRLLKQICEKKINTFKTTSVGRLFDQVSALLDIQNTPITYEGQAAIRLESIATTVINPIFKSFSFRTTQEKGYKEIDTNELLMEILTEKNNGMPIPILAFRFHCTLVQIALKMLEGFEDLPIVFCGGVFQNKLFSSMLEKKCRSLGLKVYRPQKFPANDGGISFGQIVYSRQLLE
jgi:hydrogenase maturation protein HypF